jgi:ubiquinol-cytochrome c reductase cytochrome c subunit
VALALSPVLAVALKAGTGIQEPAKAARQQEGDEEAAERRELNRRAVRDNCLICHSDELIRTQRLTPKQWKTEVEKMVGWGSPLPAEIHAEIIAYLAAEYPADGPPPQPDRETLDQLTRDERPPAPGATPRDARRAGPLYVTNCANCHGADGQGSDLGPNLLEKPILLQEGRFAEVIRRGEGRMPGFATVLDQKAEAELLAWLRGRRFRPVTPAR